MVSPIAVWFVSGFLFVIIPVGFGSIAAHYKGRDVSGVNLGIWVWGTLVVVIGCTAAVLIIMSAIYIDPISGVMYELPQPSLLPGLYRVMKDLGALIGVIVGFSSLAWVHFFTTKSKDDTKSSIETNERMLILSASRDVRRNLYDQLRLEFDQT